MKSIEGIDISDHLITLHELSTASKFLGTRAIFTDRKAWRKTDQ